MQAAPLGSIYATIFPAEIQYHYVHYSHKQEELQLTRKPDCCVCQRVPCAHTGKKWLERKKSPSCGTSPSARNLPLAKAVMILVLSWLYPCLPQQNCTLHTVTPAYLLIKHMKRRNRPLAFYSPHLRITVIFLSILLKIYPEIFSVNQPTLNTSYIKNMKAVSSDILIVYSNPVLDWSVKMEKICFTSNKVHSMCMS